MFRIPDDPTIPELTGIIKDQLEILNASDEGILVIDDDGVILFANRALGRFQGTDPEAMAGRVRELGCTAGITMNPDGPLPRVQQAIPHVDMVLLMTIYAGFGGQTFMPDVLPTVRKVKAWLTAGQRLEVDGGISTVTASTVAANGGEVLVAGSSVFCADDPAGAVGAIRDAAEGPQP